MVVSELLIAIGHVLTAPFRDLSVLWQLIPIFLMWILLEAYFVRWNESLGWNSALANAVTLFWISATSMQVLFASGFLLPHFLFFLVSIFYAAFIAYIVFKHKVRERFAFLIASPVFIHYWCILLILWAHQLMEMNWYVVCAVLILFIVFLFVDYILKLILREEEVIEHKIQHQFQQFSQDHRQKSPGFQQNQQQNNFRNR